MKSKSHTVRRDGGYSTAKYGCKAEMHVVEGCMDSGNCIRVLSRVKTVKNEFQDATRVQLLQLIADFSLDDVLSKFRVLLNGLVICGYVARGCF